MLEQVCSSCKIKKTLDNFSPNKTKPLGVRYMCKPCGAIKAKERRLEKPLSEEQKERARLRSKEWRKENPEKNKLIKSSWAKRNLATKNAANRRYETSKLKRTPDWLTKDHHQQILEKYWLAQDLKKITGEDYHVDHIVPLRGKNVSGLHVPWNLQVLPADLNLRKGTKYDAECR